MNRKEEKRISEIEERRETRGVEDSKEFFLTITSNLLINLFRRSNIIHQKLRSYKRESKKADENLATEIGQYISSLVTCWETFLRDIFIFTCQHDQEVAKRIKITLPKEIADKITVAEYYASNFHFQSLHSTIEALNFLNDKNGQQITDHMGNDFFNNIIVTSFPVVFLWVQEKMVEEKINTTIKNALAIRHRITHDANYLVKFDARLFHEIECVFQVIPQLLTIKLAEKYDQKRMVFNLKHNAVRLTNLPDTDEKPYIFSADDFIAEDYYILK